jgi:hypothetical protein
VLDCGTGGGERFVSLSGAYRFGIGLDPDPLMVATARDNGLAAGAAHVAWLLGRGEALPLADASVDMVLNRHANAGVDETLRVLRPGGLYITQQVGGRNLALICETFGCGPGGEYAFDPDESIYTVAEAFRARGAAIRAVAEYDVPYTLLDVASLLYLLQGVGIPEDYDLRRHAAQVLDIIHRSSTPHGIRTNEHRELLVAQKAA